MAETLKEGIEKKHYELAFLIKEESFARDLRRMAEQHSAEVLQEPPLKKITLAYKINGVAEAYFGFLELSAEPAAIHALGRDLKTNASILRSLVVSLPKGSRDSVKSGPRYEHPIERQTTPAKEVRRPNPLSNEALEKKIEEILQ